MAGVTVTQSQRSRHVTQIGADRVRVNAKIRVRANASWCSPNRATRVSVSAMFLLRFNGTTFNSICNCLIAGKGYRRVRVRVRAGIKGSFSA